MVPSPPQLDPPATYPLPGLSNNNTVLNIQIQTRRMNRFNEGEKAKEERLKYQKTAQVLTLFIISYIAQWLAPIIYKSWAFVMQPPNVLVRKFLLNSV